MGRPERGGGFVTQMKALSFKIYNTSYRPHESKKELNVLNYADIMHAEI